MPTKSKTHTSTAVAFPDDESRWQAVVRRDPGADGKFYYSVRTTGVYCRPTCAARLAQRKNIAFHDTCAEAERKGFRACKRCKPNGGGLGNDHAAAVARACRLLETSEDRLSLEDLAQAVGLSVYHFHRIFKRLTGVTPKVYSAAYRSRRIREELAQHPTVTPAIYGAGFGSDSRFYESSHAALGMTPKAFQKGGRGMAIRFAIGESWLGPILVAMSDKGVCAILLGDDAETLVHELEDRFPQAELLGGDPTFDEFVAKVVGFVENPSIGLDLPLDIRGTAFQQRVWQALRRISAGKTVSYTDIAKQIGAPTAVRAVATACGANALAIAIPCHRVVRSDGTLSGYRWGIERKERLLQRERQQATS